MEAIADVTQAGCDGGSTGSATINIENGSGDYTFIWNDGSTDGTRTDLPEGSYSVTVTDNQTGCVDETAFNIILVTPGEATIMFQDSIVYTTCVGSADGEVNFFANFSPFFHHPSTLTLVDSITGQEVTNGELEAGTYCLNITDANGCFITSKCFLVAEPDPIVITPVITPVTCDDLGAITINNVSNGTPDYTFDWAHICLLYTSPSPRDATLSRMPSSA